MCDKRCGQWHGIGQWYVEEVSVPRTMEDVPVAAPFLRPDSADTTTQAKLELHSSWMRLNHHQGRIEDLSVSPLTKGKQEAAHTDTAVEKRADWDHGRHPPATGIQNESAASSLAISIGNGRSSREAAPRHYFCFVLTRGFMHKSASLQRQYTHDRTRATTGGMRRFHRVWQFTPTCQNLACGNLLLDGTEIHEDGPRLVYP